jgi:hypothetical protein
MGEAGELSGRRVALALDSQREKLALLAGEIPTTIGQALTQLNNAFGMVVAGSDEAKSATAGIAGVIGETARFMVDYKDAVVAVTVALGVGGLTMAAIKAGAAIMATSGGAALSGLVSLAGGVTSLSAAYAFLQLAASAAWTAITGPIGLAITGITAVATAVYFWRARQKETTEAVKETTKSTADLYAAAKKVAEVNFAPSGMLSQIQNLGGQLRALRMGGAQAAEQDHVAVGGTFGARSIGADLQPPDNGKAKLAKPGKRRFLDMAFGDHAAASMARSASRTRNSPDIRRGRRRSRV